MKKISTVILMMVFCAALFLSLAQAEVKTAKADYFPLKVGNIWKYDIVGTKSKIIVKVTGIKKIDKKDCYKFETSIDNNILIVEYMYRSGNDILENKIAIISNEKSNTFLLKPEKKIITNPLKVGDCWVYKGKDIGSNNSMQTKKAVKEELVQVPAGKFKATRVNTNIIENGQKLDKITWYAAGIGQVKTVSTHGIVVLTEYKIN